MWIYTIEHFHFDVAASTAWNFISSHSQGTDVMCTILLIKVKSNAWHFRIFKSQRAQITKLKNVKLTCMFHVLGRCTVVVDDDFCPFACFVCCIIWLIKSNCWRVNPSLLVPAGELGDGDFELIAVIVFPSAFIWYWMQVAPCGELASPNKKNKRKNFFVYRFISWNSKKVVKFLNFLKNYFWKIYQKYFFIFFIFFF